MITRSSLRLRRTRTRTRRCRRTRPTIKTLARGVLSLKKYAPKVSDEEEEQQSHGVSFDEGDPIILIDTNVDDNDVIDFTPKRDIDYFGTLVSSEDEHEHEHEHDDGNRDGEHDWTNKITAIASSSGNLMEDLEDIMHDGCESTGSIITVISGERSTVTDIMVVDKNDLDDIFNVRENKSYTEEKGDANADLLDGNSFDVFGHDYPGNSNNNYYSNNNDTDTDTDIDNCNGVDKKQKLIHEIVNVQNHPRRPKTSRINPMIGERSFTDDIKDGITTIPSKTLRSRRKYKKRIEKEKGRGTMSRSDRLQRRTQMKIPVEHKFRGESSNKLALTKRRELKTKDKTNNDDLSSSFSPIQSNTIDPTVMETKRSELVLARNTELKKLASYNNPGIEYIKITKASFSVSSSPSPMTSNTKRKKSIVQQERKNKKENMTTSRSQTDNTAVDNINNIDQPVIKNYLQSESEYEQQSFSYWHGNHYTVNGNLPRRIAKKFLYRPNANEGRCRSKPFFGTVMSKGLEEQDDGSSKKVWRIVYDDGDEDDFDELEYQRAIDQYERLKCCDTKFS